MANERVQSVKVGELNLKKLEIISRPDNFSINFGLCKISQYN